MAKFTIPRESIEGGQVYPPGEYTIQFGGFKPKLAKEKPGQLRTTNLNPIMKIVGHPTLTNKRVFSSLNSAAGFIIRDFVHALGLKMDNEDDDARNADIPGDFLNWSDTEPEKSNYTGPLLGRSARIELVEVQAKDSQGNLVPNKTRNEIKRFFCSVPGCEVNHSVNLVK